jgi:methylthioxylose transferase
VGVAVPTRGPVVDDRPASPRPAPVRLRPAPELVAVAGAAVLVVTAFSAEPLWGDVRAWTPPLSADLSPALGQSGLPLATGTGAAVVAYGSSVAATAGFGWLLALTGAANAAWGLGLALLRGWYEGVFRQLGTGHQYIADVWRVDDVGRLLRTYTEHIPDADPQHWTTHNAAHPPLPLLLFDGLYEAGLGGSAWGGAVTTAVGATAVVAVLVTLRALGEEDRARAAAPFLALSPLVLWAVVSADGLFMGVTCWGVALLATAVCAARRGRAHGAAALALAAGVVLGLGVYLSYGLVLMAPVALAVLAAGRRWWLLGPAVAGALGVALAFTWGGFWWLEGQQLAVERYQQGIAAERPYSYWVWGNLAVVAFAVGPAVVAAAGAAVGRRPRPPTATWWLGAAAAASMVVADLTGLSKAEVERIWLPFMVWLLPLTSCLRAGRRPVWLAVHGAWGLAIGVLLDTTW